MFLSYDFWRVVYPPCSQQRVTEVVQRHIIFFFFLDVLNIPTRSLRFTRLRIGWYNWCGCFTDQGATYFVPCAIFKVVKSLLFCRLRKYFQDGVKNVLCSGFVTFGYSFSHSIWGQTCPVAYSFEHLEPFHMLKLSSDFVSCDFRILFWICNYWLFFVFFENIMVVWDVICDDVNRVVVNFLRQYQCAIVIEIVMVIFGNSCLTLFRLYVGFKLLVSDILLHVHRSIWLVLNIQFQVLHLFWIIILTFLIQ